MNVPQFSRSCAHSGSSFGSNTAHCVPRNRLSSMNRAVRRTGRYFHSDARRSAPSQRARAPHDVAGVGHRAQAVHAEWIQQADLRVREQSRLAPQRQCGHADQRRLEPGRGFPDAPVGVGARDDARHRAAGRESLLAEFLERVRRPGPAGSR